MTDVFPGRYTAQVDEPFVVFLVGMRINHFLAFRKWGPTMMAIGPMLHALYQHPEKGFLGGQTIVYWRGIGLVQYWRSFEDLERFARSPAEPHLSAWRRFNRAIGSDGSVGIWHESYLVGPGRYEAVYGNMPAFGLAGATRHVSVTTQHTTARQRLDRERGTASIAEVS